MGPSGAEGRSDAATFEPGDVVRVLMHHPAADRVGVVLRGGPGAYLVAFDNDADVLFLLADEIEWEEIEP